MTEPQFVAFLIQSYAEFRDFNQEYSDSPQGRKDRARLLAKKKKWQARRDAAIAEWRATRQPTATE